MTTPTPGPPGAASANWSGLVYVIGLGVIVTGAVIAASSWLLGGIAFAAVTALLRLLGAPEDRTLLTPSEPEAGGQLLQLFGVILLVCGACIMSTRLVAELLGLVGNSRFTARLQGIDRLGAGLAATGFIAVIATGLVRLLLYEFLLYDYDAGAAMTSLETAGYVAALIMLSGLALLLFGGVGRNKLLLGWTDRLGWGKLGHGWINKLGIGLIVLGLVGAMVGLEDSVGIIAAAGIGILLVGVILHFRAGGRP